MVLSKRWRNLFTIIPKLHFDDSDGTSFKDFMEGVLALPATSRVKNFSLKWGCVDLDSAHSYDHVNRCASHVLKRGVLVLKLQVNVKKGGYSLPFEVFTCKTVAKLKLGSGFAIDILPNDASLPALKSLFIDSVRFFDFGRCAFKTLLSACPVLEELVIDGVEWERWRWSSTLSSPTLQRLSIRRKEWYLYDDHSDYKSMDPRGIPYNNESISLDTQRLTYLEYSDFVPKKYLIVNLSSLVKAKLNLYVDENHLWGSEHTDDFDPLNLINGFKDVEIMDLSIETMEMLCLFSEAIPVFENLFHVTVSLSSYCWYSLPDLLKKSPNLKTLIIEDSLHYEIYSEKHGLVCEYDTHSQIVMLCGGLEDKQVQGNYRRTRTNEAFLGEIVMS